MPQVQAATAQQKAPMPELRAPLRVPTRPGERGLPEFLCVRRFVECPPNRSARREGHCDAGRGLGMSGPARLR